jgi:hypothetical protein
MDNTQGPCAKRIGAKGNFKMKTRTLFILVTVYSFECGQPCRRRDGSTKTGMTKKMLLELRTTSTYWTNLHYSLH